jgi:uncharacterized membrane protein YdfJ with MMPL/SSD domain
LVILLITFGAIVAAGVPFHTALVGVGLAITGITGITAVAAVATVAAVAAVVNIPSAATSVGGTTASNIDTSSKLSSALPVFLVIVFGLSSDYEVFVVSRIKEEFTRSGDARLAVERGAGFAARVVTAAALIMFGVFVAFVFFDPDPTIKAIAFTLAVGSPSTHSSFGSPWCRPPWPCWVRGSGITRNGSSAMYPIPTSRVTGSNLSSRPPEPAIAH